ncbi:ubiquitin-related modifier 1 homolog [Triticum dicoccoides]|uniref:ubiquitin-related modifier 1 homolog n=1 Tax=Triticum dicoccoides TaxID=85692 RepID=UPI00188FF1B4|nr:ubiquitin-related modifier 1 homolog [Triticum dicoccoides]
MHLTLEFGGGLELLLEKSTKVHKVDVQPRDGEDKATMKGLLSWVKSNLIKERPEMFMKDNSVYGFSFSFFICLCFGGSVWRPCCRPGFVLSASLVHHFSLVPM